MSKIKPKVIDMAKAKADRERRAHTTEDGVITIGDVNIGNALLGVPRGLGRDQHEGQGLDRMRCTGMTVGAAQVVKARA